MNMRHNILKAAVGGAVTAAALMLPVTVAEAAGTPHHPAPVATDSGYASGQPGHDNTAGPAHHPHHKGTPKGDDNAQHQGNGSAHHLKAHHRKHHKPASQAPAGNTYVKPADAAR